MTTFSSQNETEFNYVRPIFCTVTMCLLCDCRYSTPMVFPDDCVKVFDSKACEYIVHKKNDPTMLCPIYAAVGK